MPIPKPTQGEHADAFIQRCMGNPTMVNDYPDEAQRYAVCQSQIGSKSLDETINELNQVIKDFTQTIKNEKS